MSNIEQQETIENVVIPQLTVSEQGTPMASSLDVAKVFGKEHKNVLQSIENLFEDIPQDFTELNFQPSSYMNQQNKEQPMYLLTRDAFTLLAMGFTGKKAMQFKIAYIEAFNAMEKQLLEHKNQSQLKSEEDNLKKKKNKMEEKLPCRYKTAILPNAKEQTGMKGFLQFVAFLNNTTYEEVEKFYLNFFDISSLSNCSAKTANEILQLSNVKINNIKANFPRSSQPKLDLYRDTFLGLIDFFMLQHKELYRENVENYVCHRGNIMDIEQIQTEEEYLKAIFILYKAIWIERNIYEEEKAFTY